MQPTMEEKSYYVIKNPFVDYWKHVFKTICEEVCILLDPFCDFTFSRYCTGDVLKMATRNATGQCHYFRFWKDLIKLRKDRSQAAFEAALASMHDCDDDEVGGQPKKTCKASQS